jgi:hypothetical protein
VAGEYEGIRGPVTEIEASPVYMDVTLEPGVKINLPVQMGHSVIAYIFEGEALFGSNGEEQLVSSVHMVVFDDGDLVRVQAGPEVQARFMLMAGAPFGEPIVPYGPFVMNTQEEIQQALIDLRNGTFVQN